ncbi:MAG: UDP-2,4-diacetamido-2,4,6-trideoxy-beta-L-altropyranose hydrolase [Candidatus Bilamarchaeaceae archaeon]
MTIKLSQFLYIRTDANTHIGTGHIMRCIALGQAWQDEGGKVVFISHCESEKLRERIIKEGFELVTIDRPHPHPSDLELTLSTIRNISHSQSHLSLKQDTFTPSPSSVLPPPSSIWVVLDGYHFTSEYQKAIRDAGIRLLVIDDMNHLPYYHADIILNQNIHATELKYNCAPDTRLLLGTKYVLLRREFLKYKDFKREIPEKARKILVTMGGADPDNVTLKVIQALNLLNDPELEVKVVIGPSNPHIESIKKELNLSPFTFHILQGTDDMPSLMAWADLAISGGGSTCWELLYMELPSILLELSEDQHDIVKHLVRIKCFHKAKLTKEADTIILLNSLINNPELRNRQKSIIIDGEGTKRTIKEVTNESI